MSLLPLILKYTPLVIGVAMLLYVGARGRTKTDVLMVGAFTVGLSVYGFNEEITGLFGDTAAVWAAIVGIQVGGIGTGLYLLYRREAGSEEAEGATITGREGAR